MFDFKKYNSDRIFTPYTPDITGIGKQIEALKLPQVNTRVTQGLSNVSKLGLGIQGINTLASTFNEAKGLRDTSGIQAAIDNQSKPYVGADNKSLLDSWYGYNDLQRITQNDVHNSTAVLGASIKGAASGAALGSAFGPLGSVIGGGVGLLSGIVGGIFGSESAKKKQRELEQQRKLANQRANNRFVNQATLIDEANDAAALDTFYAEGGYLPSNRLKEYIKSKEHFVPYAYDDRGGPKRKWDANNKVAHNSIATIGYGFTDPALIAKGTITREEADKQLEVELNKRIAEVSKLPNFSKLAQHEKDALMALNYAIGYGNVKKQSVLMSALRTGDSTNVANALRGITLGLKDNRVKNGLAKAYQSYADIFEKGDYTNPYGGVGGGKLNIPSKSIPKEGITAEQLLNPTKPIDLPLPKMELTPEEKAEKAPIDFNIQMNSLKKINSSLDSSLYRDHKYAYGGPIEINTGGTHEENPNGGVVIGVGKDGSLHKAEEGEVKYNDYIFSNRMKPYNKEQLKKFGIKASDKDTIADIFKKLSKNANERPNSSLEKKTLDNNAQKLINLSEELKADRETMKAILGSKSNTTEYADGGFTTLAKLSPLLLSGANVLTDTLGLTNKADYSYADAINNLANKYTPVTPNALSGKLNYTPIDTQLAEAKLNAQANSITTDITRASSGNPQALMSGLLSHGYNSQTALGKTIADLSDANMRNRMATIQHNNAIDQYNNQQVLAANSQNLQQRQYLNNLALQSLQARQQELNNTEQAKSANLNALAANLGAYGREEAARAMANRIYPYAVNRDGSIDYKAAASRLDPNKIKEILSIFGSIKKKK